MVGVHTYCQLSLATPLSNWEMEAVNLTKLVNTPPSPRYWTPGSKYIGSWVLLSSRMKGRMWPRAHITNTAIMGPSRPGQAPQTTLFMVCEKRLGAATGPGQAPLTWYEQGRGADLGVGEEDTGGAGAQGAIGLLLPLLPQG